MVGLLPPNSSMTGVRFLAAAAMTTLPIGELPVKRIWSHASSSRAVVSGTPPTTTENASGSRYCGTSRARASAQAGATSDGLITAALPPAIAATSGDRHSTIG